MEPKLWQVTIWFSYEAARRRRVDKREHFAVLALGPNEAVAKAWRVLSDQLPSAQPREGYQPTALGVPSGVLEGRLLG